MSSEPSGTCPECGRLVPPESPLGFCPACMMQMAMLSGRNGQKTSDRTVVPTCEELAAHFPNLRIIKLLGQGGMGAVFHACQPKLDRDVALKILHSELSIDPEFSERFFREARALAKLNHPHIVAVHDVDQAGPYLYLVMEYVEGATLRDLMRDGGINTAEVLRMIGQICAAIQYAHDAGVVHRDIKPENILINERGGIKIADFGLAKLASPVADRLTATDTRMGTTQYMAPEQFRQMSAVDHRADIYSLGVTFYEMLTGNLPTVDYQPPSRQANVNGEVDRIIGRSLKSIPDERYQQAVEMQADVERLIFRQGRRSGLVWGGLTAALAFAFVFMLMLIMGPLPRGTTSLNRPGGAVVTERDPNIHQNSLQPIESSREPASGATYHAPPPPDSSSLYTSQWEWSEPVNLGPGVNSLNVETQPCLSADGLTLMFGSNRPDSRSPQDLWQCRRSSVDASWDPAEKLSSVINSPDTESEPCLSADGLSLIFTSNRAGGSGEMDLWISRRASVAAAWGPPENLGEQINSSANDGGATLSGDGKTLFFHTSRELYPRPRLWTATRTSTAEKFGEPIAVGPPFDTNGGAADPQISADGRVILFTVYTNDDESQPPKFDLFQSVRPSADARFSLTEPLGSPVNSPSWETGACLTWEGRTLIFESNRPGSLGSGDLWVSRRVPRSDKPAVP